MEKGELSEEEYDGLANTILEFMRKRGLKADEGVAVLLSMIIAMYKGNERTYSELESFIINGLKAVKESYENPPGK